MIKKEQILEYISNNNIELRCTHERLCVPIIDRIYKKMSAKIKFSDIKVDGILICDGHHRYVASLLANFELGRTPYPSTAATEVTDWEQVEFDTEDWDTAAKIKMLNELDAEFNNMSVEEIVEILDKG